MIVAYICIQLTDGEVLFNLLRHMVLKTIQCGFIVLVYKRTFMRWA